jgi:hypothetical protein
MSANSGLAVTATVILLIVILIASVVLIVQVRNLSVASRPASPDDRSWLDYGSLVVVLCGIVAVIVGFITILLFLGSFEDVTTALGFLTAFFGAIVGLIGTYFGIKSSSDDCGGTETSSCPRG